MDMFDPWYMALALLSSAIGTGAFMYGKKTEDLKALIIGVLLFGISYFVTSPLMLAGATGLLTAGLFSDQIQSWVEGRGKGNPRIQSVTSVPRISTTPRKRG